MSDLTRRLATVLAVLTCAVLPAVPATAQPPRGAVVVVGVPALRWADVTPTGTPALWQLAERGAVGSLSVRATGPVTPPIDGWVTLGAGNRATGRPAKDDPDVLPLVARPGGDPSFAALRRRNDGLAFDARVGALGGAVRAAGVPRVGFGAAAAVALAAPDGDIDEVHPAPGQGADFEQRLRAAVERDAVIAVELGDLEEATSPDALTSVDRSLSLVAAALRSEDTLLIAGVSDRWDAPPHLRVAVAVGPRFPPGELRSALTRRDGFVQLIDLAPTVVALAGAPRSEGMVGRQWTRVPSSAGSLDARVDRLVDADRAADGYRRYVPAFFTLLVLAQLLLYGAAFLALRRLRTAAVSGRVVGLTRGFALAFAAVPAATYLAHLVPWWRHPLPFLVALVAAVDAALYVVAAYGPWRRRPLGPEGAVAAITFVVIAVDLVTGARLQLSSLAGYSPIVAGRFAGVGNVAFAVFATGGLLSAAALCVGVSARRAVVTVAAVGAVAIVVDGSPLWGSDFGGVLALVPAFAVLGLLVSGRRVSWRSVTLIAVVAVSVVAMFALVDYARPVESQTHLGRFVGQVLHGGAGTVVRRKAQANLRLLTSSVLTLAVPIAVLFLTLVLLRPVGGLRRAFAAVPPLRAGLLSVLVLGVAGLVFNDSGVAVPALALTLAVPIALAASLACRERSDGQRDNTPA